jgi:uncharacterized protein YjbI with pentapeptide repeats
MPVARAPFLIPLNNPVIQLFSGLTFYLLLPTAMMLFAWKVAVFPGWGLGLLCVASCVIAFHAMLPFSSLSWRSKALLSMGAASIVGMVMLIFGFPTRQFYLHHADLSGQWLSGQSLSNTDLRFADLRQANLVDADLSNADLSDAKMSDAYLRGAHLNKVNLTNANLSNADLRGRADLRSAVLNNSILRNANLSFADLREANLNDSDLSKARLNDADLSGAKLTANLTGVTLRNAKLVGASLFDADLTDADLTDADLSDADLRAKAKTITQAQLDAACGNAKVMLPESESLTLRAKPCPAR